MHLQFLSLPYQQRPSRGEVDQHEEATTGRDQNVFKQGSRPRLMLPVGNSSRSTLALIRPPAGLYRFSWTPACSRPAPKETMFTTEETNRTTAVRRRRKRNTETSVFLGRFLGHAGVLTTEHCRSANTHALPPRHSASRPSIRPPWRLQRSTTLPGLCGRMGGMNAWDLAHGIDTYVPSRLLLLLTQPHVSNWSNPRLSIYQ